MLAAKRAIEAPAQYEGPIDGPSMTRKCLVCSIPVHRNDWNDHLKSAKHKKVALCHAMMKTGEDGLGFPPPDTKLPLNHVWCTSCEVEVSCDVWPKHLMGRVHLAKGFALKVGSNEAKKLATDSAAVYAATKAVTTNRTVTVLRRSHKNHRPTTMSVPSSRPLKPPPPPPASYPRGE